MDFLGCDGMWLKEADGSTRCDGQLKTFTVQEMRDSLTPQMTTAQKAEFTSAAIAFLVLCWIGKRLRRTVN